MRNLIKGMTVLVAAVVMGSVLSVPAGADTLCADWRFNSSANPAVPDATTGSPQGARLAVAVGDFGSGWHHQLPGWARPLAIGILDAPAAFRSPDSAARRPRSASSG